MKEESSVAPRGAVGLYAAQVLPGTYIKTKTGLTRGVEFFSRPDKPRPWRSVAQQRCANEIAIREREIEKLLQLCSDLRTEVGNVKNDSRNLEFTTLEQAGTIVAESQLTITRLQDYINEITREREAMKQSTEHQIRLLTAKHESELLSAKKEASLATEHCVQLTQNYQKQIKDIQAACAREVEYVERRAEERSQALLAELSTAREAAKLAEEHYRKQAVDNSNFVIRVEAEGKERVHTIMQNFDELRRTSAAELARERAEKERMTHELNNATERAMVALAERDDLLDRCKIWNNYLADQIGRVYQGYYAAATPEGMPSFTNTPTEVREVALRYAPRVLLEDPEMKAGVEQMIQRLLAVNSRKLPTNACPLGKEQVFDETPLQALVARQDRLQQAVIEAEERLTDSASHLNTLLTRLYFFSDNLEHFVAHSPTSISPPSTDSAVFVCLSVADAATLWSEDADTMRTSVLLLYSTVRLKMKEYGAFECCSGDTCMLLAFNDPVAACRFCAECQEWLLNVPWPTALLNLRHAAEQRTKKEPQQVVFRGLRVAMGMHAGETMCEPLALPHRCHKYSTHYYGPAVDEVIRLCELAQGGQFLITRPAWALCVTKRHELGPLWVTDLGTYHLTSPSDGSVEEPQGGVEVLQILPLSLKQRNFNTTSTVNTLNSAAVTLHHASLGAEITAVTLRRDKLADAAVLLREELNRVQHDIVTLVSRVRSAQPCFHLLSPPDMVQQLNDLYVILEKIALRATELQNDLEHVEGVQRELQSQCRLLHEKVQQWTNMCTSEEKLRAQMNILNERAERKIKDMGARHRETVQGLEKVLHEREQWLRVLNQKALVGGMTVGRSAQKTSETVV